MALWQDFKTNEKKLIHKWMHYFPIYEKFLNRFCNTTVTIIEIGVSQGGSLQMWERYLGPMATIIGIDIDLKCKKHEESNIHVRIGNQANKEFLKEIIDEFGEPDIVIDDGSHVMKDVIASFEYLYPKLSKNGVYLVEDMHTAYWPEYGGGTEDEDNFIHYSKKLVDNINAHHSRDSLKPNFFSNNTFGMYFFDSVVLFERGTIPIRDAPMIGKKT
ncbi:class I SAM-dependent methyltransferase [Candidatus Thioglobus sp.]|nr:class I SAM-dependent methyltransferase [Candidatus Thioglobus sp.]